MYISCKEKGGGGGGFGVLKILNNWAFVGLGVQKEQ
jgi:hypothetical protein